jgi:ADP-ribose pyrophosphatase
MTFHGEGPGRIRTQRIHDGRIIRVDEDTVRYPDGTSGTLDVVRHPGAAAVLPFLSDPHGSDPELLLLRQYRHAAGAWLVEIPAGRLEPNELPDACARRELLEETGCTAAAVTLLTTILTTPGFSDERIHLYMATGLAPGESHRERDEFIEVARTPMSDALAQIQRGVIQDAKSIVAILYAAAFCRNR